MRRGRWPDGGPDRDVRPKRLAAAATLVFALGAALLAQSQQRPTFRAGTELVQVDVVVLDEQGRPVTGLTTDDFTLFDRRRQMPVDVFSEVAHAGRDERAMPRPPVDVHSDVADNFSSQSDRVVMLVIDDINLWVDRVPVVKRLAHRIVDELGPDASMAVVFSSGRRSVEITQDRGLLHQAIETLEGAYHAMRVAGGCTPETFQSCQLLDSLEVIAKVIGAEDDQRRKAVILLSEWRRPGAYGLFDVMQPVEAPIGSSISYAAGGDFTQLPQSDGASFNQVELLQMMRALRRSNVTLYGVDPTGSLQTTRERMRESRGESPMLRMNDPLVISQNAFAQTAEATGGFAITGTNDLDAGLDRIVADLDNYYLLGFYPEDPDDESWHDLQVQVNRPGLTIRHRRGYQLGVELELPENDDRLVALSAGALPTKGLPLKLFATPAVRDGNDARVAIAAEVRVPAERLERPGGRLEDTLTLTALAVNLKNQKVDETARHEVDFTVPRSRIQPDGTVTYQLVFGMDLSPGTYQLRVSAESARMDEAGSVYLTVDVPHVRDARVAIAGPTIGLPPGGRRPAGMTLAEAGLLPPQLDPMLDRIFLPTEILRVFYQVWRRDDRNAASARLEILDETGRVRLFDEQTIGARTDGVVDVSIPLAGLPPGPYRLRISATLDEYEDEREIGFAVRSAR